MLVPDFNVGVKKVYALVGQKVLPFRKIGNNVWIDLPSFEQDAVNTIVVVEYMGTIPEYNLQTPITISSQFDENRVDAIFAKTNGNIKTSALTYSHYYGDWKHTTCVTNMKDSTDQAIFAIKVIEPGDYRVIAEYNCPQESERLEGSLNVNGQGFLFRTLRTSEFDKKSPLMFIKHTIATTTFKKAGLYYITVHPLQNGKELFKLKSIILEPVK